MLEELIKCKVCPHKCKVNRLEGKIGRCKCNDKIKIALVSTHMYEEPCISGTNGSGTIFFSNCNLACKFCQNYEISQLGKGHEITIEELASVMVKQQEAGVHNINLVTPTMYAYQIIEAIKIARKCIHIVYENIYFAIGIKILCLILGALGIANMWMAIFADVGVMIIAVLNAIRTLFVKNL